MVHPTSYQRCCLSEVLPIGVFLVLLPGEENVLYTLKQPISLGLSSTIGTRAMVPIKNEEHLLTTSAEETSTNQAKGHERSSHVNTNYAPPLGPTPAAILELLKHVSTSPPF